MLKVRYSYEAEESIGQYFEDYQGSTYCTAIQQEKNVVNKLLRIKLLGNLEKNIFPVIFALPYKGCPP